MKLNQNFYLTIVGLAWFATGCASSQKPTAAIRNILDHEVGSMDTELAERIMSEARPYRLAKKSKKTSSQLKLENEIHQRVWWWIRYYTVRERELFERATARGANFKPLVQQVLKEHQLPSELYYLALIESGFVTHATSHASAVGIWQFMKPTALNYGLGVDGAFDERQHPISATHAAAKYLAFLNKKFNSWYLAIAAYNAGQGRISDAIRRGKTNNFWVLAEKGYLPQETMDYIPKFLAAATIGENLKKFGFDTPRSKVEWPRMMAVKFKRGKARLRTSDIAFATELEERDLVRFNPHLPKMLSQAGPQSMRIWLPVSAAKDFIQRTQARGWGKAAALDVHSRNFAI